MCFKNFWNWLTGASNNTPAPIEPPAPENVNEDITSDQDGNMIITVINKSTLISNAEVKNMVRAVAIQARQHAAPAWDLKPPKVVYRTSEETCEPGSWKVLVFDDADMAGALGYHSDGPDGLPYGRVFVKVSQQYNFSVSSVLSHEVLEIMMDPQINYWADNWNDKLSYALEVCDPVENDSYNIDVNGTLVEVSNFVLPAWFDPIPPAGAKFDYLGKVSKPFTMTSNGYVIVRDQTSERAVFGATYPEWKKELKLKSASRTKHRHVSQKKEK